MPKPSLYKSDTISPIDDRIMKFMPFPKDIHPKVNVMTQLKFRLANFKASVQHHGDSPLKKAGEYS